MEDTIEYWEQDKSLLRRFDDESFCATIPSLEQLLNWRSKLDKLVKFRGMIQDILNPVYYLEKCDVTNVHTKEVRVATAKYRDVFEYDPENEKILFESVNNVHSEKYLMHCVQIPGLNSWTQQIIENRSDEMELNAPAPSIEGNITEQSDSSPIFETSCVRSCLLNVYDIKDGDLKVNEVVEVFGFLNLTEDEKLGGTPDDMEDMLNSKSYAIIPQIQVIYFKRCSSSILTEEILNQDKEYILESARFLREELWLILSQLLCGDTLAADYVLCHLISSVYLRKDELVLGKLSVNFSSVPAYFHDYVPKFYNWLSDLVEKSVLITCTEEYLNTATLIPTKKGDDNRLVPGSLQLSPGTHLFVDETKLETEMQLTPKGLSNQNAVNELIRFQKLSYDFDVYSVQFPTDIPVLSFSKNKSLFSSDCHILMKPDVEMSKILPEIYDKYDTDNPENVRESSSCKISTLLLNKFRRYIAIVFKLGAAYDLPSSVQEMIQSDFVDMRKNPLYDIGGNDLHQILVLARLVSLSRGYSSLNGESWKHACWMDQERRQRFASVS